MFCSYLSLHNSDAEIAKVVGKLLPLSFCGEIRADYCLRKNGAQRHCGRNELWW